MESGFLTFILVSSFAVYSSHVGVTDWDDVVVAREGMPTTLVCTDTTVRGDVAINWKVQSLGADEWKLVLSASERKEFSGGASKASMRLIDPNFQDTGVFSLFFLPSMEDSGLYSCLIKQQGRTLKERIILLAILTVTVVPPAPILQHSTLRLIASVTPDFAATKITWAAPGGISMKSEKKPKTGTVAKLPQVQIVDSGAYICMVHPQGNSSSTLFAFNVDVTIDDDNVASFPNVTHASFYPKFPVGPLISTATQAQTSFTLTCPVVQGDYVRLYWHPPDNKNQNNMKLVYHYDRWRGSTLLTEQSKRLQLAGPPYNAEAGSFSFLLTPGLKDGGLYICDVYLNENAFSQRTLLSVLKVKTSHSSSKMELGCLYSERSQVQSANWKYQNKSRRLKMLSNGPGSISTILPVPITSDTAGNYTCTVQLKNGQTVWAIQAVTLPREVGMNESDSVTTPSLLPSLSALLLLVPLVAAAVCVLLWRQKHISERGIEQSLSVHSGEAENIYENPEDYRQAPPEGSVYMDLKPRGEDDVYKELERSEQCQS
ncbi:g6f-like isoform X1 [Dicentrarchus labrax]|uniref:g6f-like isoform X1 n=1 Tax=Dicentrarchus labrax TaxID=13489 RepID=UPI0021F62F4A|nr:g6f-like isoform X1 [Dicentrarchus labrax]